MFPVLETSYHGFAGLSNRTHNENLQLNIVLYQGVCSGLSFWRSLINECYLKSYRKLKGIL